MKAQQHNAPEVRRFLLQATHGPGFLGNSLSMRRRSRAPLRHGLPLFRFGTDETFPKRRVVPAAAFAAGRSSQPVANGIGSSMTGEASSVLPPCAGIRFAPQRQAGLLKWEWRTPDRFYPRVFVNLKEDTMANITRYDPFEATDPLDTLFRGFFRPVRLDKEAPQIRMDVKEDETSYAVHADIPGVAKDDIQVTIDGNTVAISAEVRKSAERKEGEKVLRRERYFGRVGRSFALEHEVDEAAATARYQDGVLELVLPKKAAAAAKRLAVQ